MTYMHIDDSERLKAIIPLRSYSEKAESCHSVLTCTLCVNGSQRHNISTRWRSTSVGDHSKGGPSMSQVTRCGVFHIAPAPTIAFVEPSHRTSTPQHRTERCFDKGASVEFDELSSASVRSITGVGKAVVGTHVAMHGHLTRGCPIRLHLCVADEGV